MPPGLVLKTVATSASTDEVWENFKTEKAMQRVIQEDDGTDGVPRMYTMNPKNQRENSLNRACCVWSIAMEFVGDYSLNKLAPRKPAFQQAVNLGLIIARAIQILIFVHELGIVHGDIHGGNLVHSDPANIPETLRLIDFGRSRFVIDEHGRQVIPNVDDYDGMAMAQWDEQLLSPWELIGEQTSFRDDLFRLAELGVRLERNGGVIDLTDARAQASDSIPSQAAGKPAYRASRKYFDLVATAKLSRKFNYESPLVEFYRATVELTFSERFDHDGWAAKLEAAAPSS